MAVRAYESVIHEELIQGLNIVNPTCNIGLSISGIFNLKITKFDPKRHHVNLNYTSGVDFRKIGEQIELVKIEAAEIIPDIKYFENSTNNTQNDKITPATAAKIKSSRISTNKDDT